VKNGGKDMVEVMTDKQFDKIIKMISMILDGCKDLDEAKKKVNELSDTPKKEKN
jgi:hypothetical protein